MHIHTEIGEIGLDYAGHTYRLRPSLAAMASLGSPAEIVELFGQLFGPSPALTGNDVLDVPRVKRWALDRFLSALSVLHACSEDDLSPLIGGISPRMHYQPGRMPMDNVVVLAQALMHHGIVGAVPPDPNAAPARRGTYTAEFNARDYAAQAVAHLGMSEPDAWNMTMTGFVLIMRAKFPPPEKAKRDEAPTAEAHDATMAWLEAVNKARAPRNG